MATMTIPWVIVSDVSRAESAMLPEPTGAGSGRGCAWRDGRGATGEDRRRVSTETPGERSRSHHSEGQGGRAPPVEEGGGLPPAGPGGKRLLPVQVDHWRPASCSTSGGSGNRSGDRVQHPEPDDRAWSTGLVCGRAVTVAGSERFSLAVGFMHQRQGLRQRVDEDRVPCPRIFHFWQQIGREQAGPT